MNATTHRAAVPAAALTATPYATALPQPWITTRRALDRLVAQAAGSGVLRLAVLAGVSALVGPMVGAPGTLAMAAIAFAACLSSIAGFAFSAICGGMLFHLVPDPVHAVQIMILCAISNQAVMTWAMRREVVWRNLAVYLAGGVLGLPAGVWLLLHADHRRYTLALGALLLAYGIWMLLRRPLTLRRQHPLFDLAIGALGGITGGAAGFPGAAITIWCGFKGWNKTQQRALFQPFILIMQVASLAAINLAGASTSHGLSLAASDLLVIPASLLGTAIGMTFFRGMSDSHFVRAVNVLLIVSGLAYLL